MRGIGAAAVLAVCMVAFVGQAGADEFQTLSITGDTATEGGTATFTVSLSEGTDSSATVNFATADGSATAGEDYTDTSEALTVPAGGSVTVDVPILDGSLDEPTESFTGNLSGAVGAVIGTASATATINDNDPAPSFAISGPTSVDEDDGTATYSVAITGQSAGTVTVNYATANGTTTGADYTPVSGTLTWGSGDSLPQEIVVPIANDTLDEPDETFSVNLSGATGGATIGTATKSTTIVDQDAQPTTTTFADASVSEGAGTINFVVNLSAVSGKPITVNYSTIDGTATTANNDYVAEVNQNLTIPAGQPSGTISIAVTGDGVPEPNETFTVNLNSGTNVSLGGDTQSQGTIVNDDNAVTASINDVTVTEGSSTTNAVFTILLSAPAPAPVTITYRTADGSAAAPGDYTSVPNTTVPIAQGASSVQVTVVVNGDAVPEPTQNFFVDLVGFTGPVSIADSRGTGTIVDDDSTPSATINDVTVTEGASPNTVNAVFTVSLSSAAPAPITITYRTADGTATSPADYNGVGNTVLPIAQGASSAQLTIQVKGDALPEGLNENFFVDLVGFTGPVTIGDGRGIGTITDDDVAPTASINDVTVTEGASPNTVNAVFTVTLSSQAAAPVTVTYKTANGSAVSPDDYTGVPNAAVAIGTGQTSAQLTIVVKGDALPEGPSENFFVDLINATGPATIGSDSRGIGTITDDDSPVTASINDVAVTEGHTSTVNATFTVALSGAAAAPLEIRYSTLNGTAGQPGDYVAKTNALLTIAAGATSGQFSIVVNGDTLPEGAGTPPAENFFVDLISTSGPVTISSDSRGTGTITDDDNPVSASINDVAVTEGHAGNVNATFTVALSGPAQAALQIRYSTANSSAVSPGDYTGVTNALLTIAQGASSGTFSIVVKGDVVPEGTGTPLAEEFFVDLINSSGPVTISSDSRGRGSIVDDDSPVTASINDASVTEGNTGSVSVTFTVALSGPAPGPVQIRYSTLDSSAVAPGDYTTVTNGTLTIAQGAISGLFTIVVNGDTTYEGEGEDFFVDLISATGPATISSDSRGRGTIVEDDPAPPAPPGGGGGGVDGQPSLSITDTLAREGVDASFTVTLTGNTTRTVTVNASTTNGTATGGSDFVIRNETLIFAPGEKTKTVVLSILDDSDVEEIETFWLRLSQPVNASISKTLGTATIEASDGVTPAGPRTPDGPTGPVAKLPRMVLGPPTVNVFAKGFAIMTVSCLKASPIACSGSVVLEKTTGKPVLKFGTKPFTVQKGKKASIRIYLSAKALNLLLKTKTGSMRARAVVLVKNSLKKNVRVVPGIVTLRATKGLLTQDKELKVSEPKQPPTKVQIVP